MRTIARADVWLSITLFAIGLWAFLQSRTFDEVSGGYPQALSLSITALAVILFVESIKNKNPEEHTGGSIKSLFSEMSGSVMILALFVFWTFLLTMGAGYLPSSLLIIAAALWLLGLQSAGYIVIATSGIVAFVFTLFYLLLDVPLPLHRGIQALLG
jgi:hypothetical protein